MSQKKIFSAEKRQSGDEPAVSTEPVVSGGGISHEQYEELLSAIHSVKDDIASGMSENSVAAVNEAVMADFKKEFADSFELKHELEALSSVILDTRREIASLQDGDTDKKKFHAMTDQLDAVVGDTETATNAILEAVETIEDKNESLELNATDPDELEITEAISNAVMKIYEACSFQDITGQRITKVVSTLKFVEDRIGAMISILGGDAELEDLEKIKQDANMDGEVELSGPRAEGQEISQDEIDALFD
ncbi:MAG: protein phosphatase CheZ [Sneathiella sp.]|nr:protein phosphatase CheZ [Sneathiella sp.]